MNLPSKNFKKITIKLVATIGFLLLILCITNKVKADTFNETIDDCTWEYEVEDNKAINVRIKEWTSYPYIINIPSSLGGYDVVSVGNGINNITNEKFITHFDPASSIQEFKGEGPKIVSIKIPNTVEKINNNAFKGCFKLMSIDFGNSLKSIGMDAFSNCAFLTLGGELVFPETLEEIGPYAFSLDLNRCDEMYGASYAWWVTVGSFDSIRINSNLKKIGEGAFEYCIIENLNIPSNVTTLGKGSFARTRISSLTLPNSNIEIGEYAFSNCDYLTSVTIPSNIVTIRDFAFSKCSQLESITFETRSQTLNLGNYAFAGCASLPEVTIIKNIQLGEGVFQNCTELVTATFEDTQTTTGNYTFSQCLSLENVVKTNTIVTVGNGAFEGCSSLTTEEYNDIVFNVTNIGNNAFAGCTGLSDTLEVKNIVTNLGKSAFAGCTGLKKVLLNANITTVPDYCFYNCTNLAEILYSENINAIGIYTFSNCFSIKIPELESQFLNHIAQINKFAFQNDYGLNGELTIPESVQIIGDYAFENCKNINNIIFNNTLTNIGSFAFYSKGRVFDELTINSRANIGNIAFYNVKDLFLKDNGTLLNRFYGYFETFVHYKNCTHKIDITATLPGVSLTKVDGSEITSNQFECKSTQRFKLNIAEGYSYPNLQIKVISQGEYGDSENVEEYITLNENNEFEISNITRDKQIIVERDSNGTDLVLRQFITEVNGHQIIDSRKPNIIVNNTKLLSFDYNHTKQPVVVNSSDEVTYNIRIYNEGKKDGNVQKVGVKLGEGISFKENNDINQLYNWQLSEDGKTITTDYLSEKTISKYEAGRPEYEEIQYVCIVKNPSVDSRYMVTMAEIFEGNDTDSCPNSTSSISLKDYMITETSASNRDTYLKGIEDDTDIETIMMKDIVQTGYNLVIKKTDYDSNELLNGAKFKLYDENKTEITTGVCVNGEIDFGSFSSFGEGTDIYYIEEVEVPIGYKRTIDGLLKLIVNKQIETTGEVKISITCDLKEINFEYDKNPEKTVNNFIPITSAEQLSKIGSGETIEINGKNYVFAKEENYQLQNDIDLSGISNWKPIDELVGVFDGNGHKISNLNITLDNNSADTNAEIKVGLFASVSGTVKNLKMENATITTNTEAIRYAEYAMALTKYENAEKVYNSIKDASWASDAYKEEKRQLMETAKTELDALESLKNYFENGYIGVIAGIMEEGNIDNCSIIGGQINFYGKNIGGLVGQTNNIVSVSNSTVEMNNIIGIYNVAGLVGVSKDEIFFENCENKSNIKCVLYNAAGILANAVSDVSIKNCTNSKNIEAFESDTIEKMASNLGGIIGYVNDGHYVVLHNSNNTGNITGKNNIGGIIGFSESYTDIQECSNTAEINGVYNIGGITGYSYAKNCKPRNLDIVYDNNLKTITVYVKNKEYIDLYDLNIQKADISLGKKLAGAEFNIYNSDKVLIKENAPVDEHGNLIINDLIMNSEGTDVYYIKEAKAPSGYEILVKEYIKVEIYKKWDKINEKYILDTRVKIAEEMTDEELENITAKTGKIDELEDYQSIIYAVNGTSMQAVSNTGNITGTNSVGGILGGSCSNVYINTAENSGNISGQSSIGGIAGGLYAKNEKIFSDLTDCVNTGNVNSENYAGAGIVAMALDDITIANSENSGEITARDAAGILSTCTLNTKVYNCNNTGKINPGPSGDCSGAGIVANSFGIDVPDYRKTESKYLEVVECYNSGDVIGAGILGGIVGRSDAVKLIVEKCNVENCEIKGSGSKEVGGILGCVVTDNGNVNECNVSMCNIGNGGKATGIVGNISDRKCFWNGDNFRYWDVTQVNKIKISNSKVIDSIIEADEATGVIICGLMEVHTVIDIENVEVKSSTKDKNTMQILGTDYASGVYGSTMLYSTADNNEINVTNCIVDSANISGGMSAGIMITVYGTYDIRMNFDNNIIKNVSLIHRGKSKGGIDSAGGIIANSYVYTYDDTKYELLITNSIIENINIDGSFVNAGGIAGYLYGSNGLSSYIYIDNCDVKNINMNINEEGGCHNYGGLIGGKYGRVKMNVKNTVLKGFDINVEARYGSSNYREYLDIGGAIGSLYGIADFENIIIDGKKENGENSTIKGNCENVGGFMGLFYPGSPGDYSSSVTNCSVNNIDIGNVKQDTDTSYKAKNCGGFFALEYTKQPVKDIKVEDINIVYSAVETIGGFSGGLVCWGQDETVDNVKLSNINIKSESGGRVGGFVGFNATGINDVTLDNIVIDYNAINGLYYADHAVDVVGGVTGVQYEASQNNVTANNIQINVNSTLEDSKGIKVHSGGINGVNTLAVYMNNIIGNDITISETNIFDGTKGGLVGVGNDCRSHSTSQSYIQKISNVDLSNIKITGSNVIGGVIGSGLTQMTDVTLKNPIIIAKNGTQKAIAGSVAGISTETSQISNIKVTADTDTDETYGVFSDYIAGGLIGINSGDSFTDSSVENITVKTNAKGNGASIDIDDLKEGATDEIKDKIDASSDNIIDISQGNSVISDTVVWFIKAAVNCIANNVIIIK